MTDEQVPLDHLVTDKVSLFHPELDKSIEVSARRAVALMKRGWIRAEDRSKSNAPSPKRGPTQEDE